MLSQPAGQRAFLRCSDNKAAVSKRMIPPAPQSSHSPSAKTGDGVRDNFTQMNMNWRVSEL